MLKIYSKSVIAGLTAVFFLVSGYFIILTWVGRDWRHPWQEFLPIKFWLSALFLGFGVQVGIYWFTKSTMKIRQAKGIATANASLSTGTMIACCAHHLSDFLPILGISALSVFLIKYQVYLLILAVSANLLGITYMLWRVNKSKFNFIIYDH